METDLHRVIRSQELSDDQLSLLPPLADVMYWSVVAAS